MAYRKRSMARAHCTQSPVSHLIGTHESAHGSPAVSTPCHRTITHSCAPRLTSGRATSSRHSACHRPESSASAPSRTRLRTSSRRACRILCARSARRRVAVRSSAIFSPTGSSLPPLRLPWAIHTRTASPPRVSAGVGARAPALPLLPSLRACGASARRTSLCAARAAALPTRRPPRARLLNTSTSLLATGIAGAPAAVTIASSMVGCVGSRSASASAVLVTASAGQPTRRPACAQRTIALRACLRVVHPASTRASSCVVLAPLQASGRTSLSSPSGA